MQAIMNLLPNLNVPALVDSMLGKSNDMHLAMYISALIRSVIALHDLVNNKLKYSDGGEEDQKKAAEAEAKKKKEAEAKEKKEAKKKKGDDASSSDGEEESKSSGSGGSSSS